NNGIDFNNVRNELELTTIIIWGIILIVLASLITYLILKYKNAVNGDPIYLMIINSAGIPSYSYTFSEELIKDTVLAGGALVGIQSIIQEISGSPNLVLLDSGENKILITKLKIDESLISLEILVWATQDDPKLRRSSQQLGEYIITNHLKVIQSGEITQQYERDVEKHVYIYFGKWLK
ncbi:MAG: hypothetical protein OEY49_13920, partial [Candidatus Heimdallarchaeota archaeon]|nr:hypothetical protein [Candidatus Heimdallarchaeota archaeon]